MLQLQTKGSLLFVIVATCTLSLSLLSFLTRSLENYMGHSPSAKTELLTSFSLCALVRVMRQERGEDEYQANTKQ
jgi:hypothetical protein